MKKSDGNRVLRVPRYEKMEGETKLLIFYDGPRKMGKVLEWHKWDGPCQIQAIIIIIIFCDYSHPMAIFDRCNNGKCFSMTILLFNA